MTQETEILFQTEGTENLIRVDNLGPLIEYQKIDSTGRVLELKFNEELDLNPEIGDISLSLTNGNGLTNSIVLTNAEIINTNDRKSIVKYHLSLPVFANDTYELDFTTGSLSKSKDLVGKVFQDPGTLAVATMNPLFIDQQVWLRMVIYLEQRFFTI